MTLPRRPSRPQTTNRSSSPRLLVAVGLGNPGRRYAKTRHNVGFRVVECLAARYGAGLRERRARRYRIGMADVGGTRLTLVQPQAYMNASGDVMAAALTEAGGASYADVIVVCDTLDLPPGSSRLRSDGSSAGNRGLASIVARAGNADVARIYIGVGRPEAGESVIDYVLSRPRPEDAIAIAAAVDRVCSHFDLMVEGDLQAAMNVMNVRG